MGNMVAQGLEELCIDYGISKDAAVLAHLRGNCYPPIHKIFLSMALEAIRLASIGHYEAKLVHPVTGQFMTVSKIVRGMHLDAFVEDCNG
jgi:hypothetical protein